MNNFLPNNENSGWIKPVTLESDNVVLEPLSISHHSDLQEATKDGELWKIWYIRVPSPENMLAVIQDRIKLQESGEMFTFAVINKNMGKAVGMTSFFKVVSSSRKVDIGWTWYQQSVQRIIANYCVYSITQDEWPAIKVHLQSKLAGLY